MRLLKHDLKVFETFYIKLWMDATILNDLEVCLKSLLHDSRSMLVEIFYTFVVANCRKCVNISNEGGRERISPLSAALGLGTFKIAGDADFS